MFAHMFPYTHVKHQEAQKLAEAMKSEEFVGDSLHRSQGVLHTLRKTVGVYRDCVAFGTDQDGEPLTNKLAFEILREGAAALGAGIHTCESTRAEFKLFKEQKKVGLKKGGNSSGSKRRRSGEEE